MKADKNECDDEYSGDVREFINQIWYGTEKHSNNIRELRE